MSQLASQLRKLQLRPVGASDRSLAASTGSALQAGASFLFSKSDARSYSREQILELATVGLRTLLQLDNRFQPFVSLLFHPEKTRQERSLLTTAEDKVLNQDIETFLVFLSPHLFLTAAHQVLEYLIRVHEVHVYNTTALIRAFLPYHDHNIFSRMLLLVDLRDTGFDFLATNQERGAPLVREDLLVACKHSRKVLQQVCYCMMLPVRLGLYHGAANALFAAVASRLAVAPPSSATTGAAAGPETIWRQMLPFVLECLTVSAPGLSTVTANGAGLIHHWEGVETAQSSSSLDPAAAASSSSPHTASTSITSHRASGGEVSLPHREAVCTALLVVAAWSAEVQFAVPMLLTMLKPILAFTMEQAQMEKQQQQHQHEEGEDPNHASGRGGVLVMPLESWLLILDLLFRSQKAMQTDRSAFSAVCMLLLQIPWRDLAETHPSFRMVYQRQQLQQQQQQHRQPRASDNEGEQDDEAVEVPLAALLSTLLTFCLERVRVSRGTAALSADVQQFLLTATTVLPLPPVLVRETLLTLLRSDSGVGSAAGSAARGGLHEGDGNDEVVDEEPAAEAFAFYASLVQALERRYQRLFDETLSAALQDADLHRTATRLLARHLEGTRYEMITLLGGSQKKQQQQQQSSSACVSLPLFACLMHPSAEVRALGVSTMEEKLSAPQWISSSTSATAISSSSNSNAGEEGGSLLELLAHVLSYESDPAVASAMLHAASGNKALWALADIILMSAEAEMDITDDNSGLKKKKKSSSSIGDDKRSPALDQCVSPAYAMTMVKALLHAARSVVLLHSSTSTPTPTGASLRKTYWEQMLMPLLKRTAKEASKRSTKRASPSEEVTQPSAVLHSLVLYNACLLYSVVLSKHQKKKNQQKQEQEPMGDGDSLLAEGILTTLKELFPEIPSALTESAAGDHAAVDEKQRSTFPLLPLLSASPSLLTALHATASPRLPELLRQTRRYLQRDHDDQKRHGSHGPQSAEAMISSEEQALRDGVYMECAIASLSCLFHSLTAAAEDEGKAKEEEYERVSCQSALQLLDFLLGSRYAEQLFHGTSVASIVTSVAGVSGDRHSVQTLGSSSSSDPTEATEPNNGGNGYLFQLQQLQRDALRLQQQQSQGKKQQPTSSLVGRGAANSILTSGYLPSNAFTTLLASGVSCAVRLSLQQWRNSQSQSRAATVVSSPFSSPTALHLSTLLLPLLGSSLPSLAECPAALPYTFFRLLPGLSSGAAAACMQALERQFNVPFYTAVHEAVFGNPKTGTTAAASSGGVCCWGAVGLTLLLPLCAPEHLRQGHIELVQDAILQAQQGAATASGGRKGSAAAVSTAAVQVLADALRAGTTAGKEVLCCSITSLSAVVEGLAKDTSRLFLPPSATRLLAMCLISEWRRPEAAVRKEVGNEESGEQQHPSGVWSTPQQQQRAQFVFELPRTFAVQVLQYFFLADQQQQQNPEAGDHDDDNEEQQSVTRSGASKRKSSSSFSTSRVPSPLPLEVLYPSVKALLTITQPGSGEDEKVGRRKTRANHSTHRTVVITEELADYIEAICARSTITPWAAPSTSTSAPSLPPAIQLVMQLLQKPFLHVRRNNTFGAGNAMAMMTTTARPLYRYALSMLAKALEQGVTERRDSAGVMERQQKQRASTLIFRASASGKGKNANDTTEGKNKNNQLERREGLSEAQVEEMTSAVRPLLFSALLRMGSGSRDVARLCVQTIGGFHRLFLPLLNALSSAKSQEPPPQNGNKTKKKSTTSPTHSMPYGLDEATALEVLAEQLDLLKPTTAPTLHADANQSAEELQQALEAKKAAAARDWVAPSESYLPCPLTFAHCDEVLAVCASLLPNEAASQQPVSSDAVTSLALRVVSTVIHVAATVVVSTTTTHDSDSDSDDDDEPTARGGNNKPRHATSEDGERMLITASNSYAESLHQLLQEGVLGRFSLQDTLLPLLLGNEGEEHHRGNEEEEKEEEEGGVHRDEGSVAAQLDAVSGVATMTPFTRPILSLLQDLVHVSLHCTTVLREGGRRGATRGQVEPAVQLRTALLKDGLTVMGVLLLPAAAPPLVSSPLTGAVKSRDEKKTNNNDNEEEIKEEEGHVTPRRVALISALLRTLSPLLAPTPVGSAGMTTAAASMPETFALHIPIVALLIRLEPVTFTQTLGYKSSVEVCREVLTSFDVVTQMQCLSQLMALVCDPEAALQRLQQQHSSASATGEESLSKLFRKLVKPNQIINRQELLLQVINTTVKCDAFLAPFIQIQYQEQQQEQQLHHDGANGKKNSKNSGKKGIEQDNENDEGDEDGAKSPLRKTQSEAGQSCTVLLTSALSLYSHYSDLNESTPFNTNTRHSRRAEEDEDEGSASEEKSYVMLLELLAGNTLACVLAGINEPTFVHCLDTLLKDQRVAVQQKGLEVLLDRLHHSLPTAVEEHAAGGAGQDAEVEAYRKALRDPKHRLNLMDLIRVRARPLTTKRSYALEAHLTAIVTSCLAALKQMTPSRSGLKSTTSTVDNVGVLDSAAASSSLRGTSMVVFQRLLLSICCMEELIRIVGSGGSMQAEKTLLNVHRSKSVSVPTLVKLFGNKKRVDSVRQFLRSLCVEWIPALQEGLRATLASAHRRRQQLQQQQPPQPLAATGTSWLSASEAAMVEGYQGAMTALFTFLGTCSQVMGAGFLLSHCQEVLEVITSSAIYQVTEWASATSAGMPSGSLQRTTTTTTTTMANLEESASLWRYATLTAVLRSFPGCWHMSQPFLTPLLLVAVHRVNVDDSRTNPLCQEVLAVLEAVMEPQLLLRAAAECLWGWEQTTTGLPIKPAIARVNTTATTTSAASSSSVSFRLSTAVHAVPLLYQSVTRLLERLNREEISHMRFLCDGTLARDNFWLASLDMLARSPVLPPSETTMVVLNAFQTFFVKFKAKHCNVFLSNIAMWAFGEQHGGPADSLGSEHSRALNTPTAPDQHKKKRRMEEGDEGEEDEEDDTTNRVKPNPSSPTGTSLAPLTRLSLHRWTLFYSLYNHLLTKLESIMDFSFGVAMPYVIQHLHRFNDNHHNSAPLEADSDGEGDNDDHHHRRGGQEKSLSSRLALFLEGVLEALRRVCTACTPGPDYDYRVTPDVYVAHTEVFNAVMPAAVRQLSNQTGLSDSMHPFPHRVEHHVLPTLRAMFIALGSSGQGTNSNKLQSKMQAEVLRSLRHPSPAVRRMALKALDGMYEDGGEELAARLMAEMLPSVVEMTEDRDALVVEEARTLCDHLSTITGQDVLHAMSG